MYLPLFVTLVSISLLLVFLGYYAKEGAYSLIGFFFIFLLGASVLLPGSLAYKTGDNVTITSDNSTGATIISELHTDTYTNFSDGQSHSFGIWLAALGAVGIAITLNELRKGV